MSDDLRIGLGIDLHRLENGRPCRLGGITIESPVGPAGHSDGDVILHAACDAILGAAGRDDIGTLFPDTDDEFAAMDSAEICKETNRQIVDAGFRLVSLDIVVEAERPKIAPHRAAMRARLAELFGIDADRINIRGKTAEKLGHIGRGDALRATAVALLASR